MKHIAFAVAGLLGLVALVPATSGLSLTPIGTENRPFRGRGSARRGNQRLRSRGQRIYVVNPASGVIDIIDVSNPAAPTRPRRRMRPESRRRMRGRAGQTARSMPATSPTAWPIQATCSPSPLANPVRTNNGHAVFFELQGANAEFLAAVEVGALPDMITFTEDGK